jgi:hypothetical protein
MKIQRTVTLLAGLILMMLQATAQESPSLLRAPDYNKPKRFADLPEKQPLHLKELESLLHLPVGSNVSVSISKHFLLQGSVVSVSNPSDKLVKSVVVRSNNRPGTAFTFTRLTESDGRFTYTGRMIGRDTGDAMEIIKDGEGYVLRKKNVYEIISE